ncbi:gluzincin family metallopeptidase [Granulicella aggregans]|uniref:hypothetical protein n=1 Tax=Granulicella aggregans TaxID=474949 RepID=UPI0021E0D416|nr:hypothetical protein [Granulicella aggregans]
MGPRLRHAVFVFVSVLGSSALSQENADARKSAATYTIQTGGAALQIDFAAGELDLPQSAVVNRIQRAALAVAAYYGRFPLRRARILVIPTADEGGDGVLQGTTWGGRSGWPGFTRIRIGRHTTRDELAADWIITHELVHMALSSLPDDEHWLEEGIATYVEPIARAQTGELTAERVWGDMVAGMPNGEPAANDRGMDNTHTWGRTYWGGAIFCLVADIEIRKQTKNRKGLQDALRGIVASGGTIDTERPVKELLRVGDEATETHVLEEMYAEWSQKPVKVDLDQLWSELGINRTKEGIRLDLTSPLSRIRVMLTTLRATVVPPLAKSGAAVSDSASRL